MKHPELTPVKSSNIDAIGHRGDSLWIRFKGGTVYSYDHVPEHVFKEGLAYDKAEDGSVGRWFRDKVRGTYKHTKHA